MPPLTHRPYIRALLTRLAAIDRGEIVAEPAPPVSPAGALSRFAREPQVGWLVAERGRASRVLYERLAEADVAEVEARIREAPELASHYEAGASEAARSHMILAFGMWLGVPCVSERTGLTGAQPPDEVHAMARGPIAAAGGLYEADMVVDALASCGVQMSEVGAALDFGCSSARVVRVLAAAYPEVRWHGCDPNGPAIEWAQANLPGIDFFRSGDAPPLPLADESLDMAYAISIWSHFAPALGLRWFDEMHRLIRPGGHLVFTTHGPTSVGFYATRELRSPQQSDEIVGDLYRRGWWYAAEFGEQGDWGVVNPEWGTAFLSPEWLLANLCPRWQVLEYAPGRNQENQDVYVVRRV